MDKKNLTERINKNIYARLEGMDETLMEVITQINEVMGAINAIHYIMYLKDTLEKEEVPEENVN